MTILMALKTEFSSLRASNFDLIDYVYANGVLPTYHPRRNISDNDCPRDHLVYRPRRYGFRRSHHANGPKQINARSGLSSGTHCNFGPHHFCCHGYEIGRVLMVNLDKIYTRGGDTGQTSLASGTRVPKHDLRVEAYGTVDEANALIGLARLATEGQVDDILGRVQNDLFDLGADLARPRGAPNDPAEQKVLRSRPIAS